MCARTDSGRMLRETVGALAEAVERIAPLPPFHPSRVRPELIRAAPAQRKPR